MEKAGYYEPSPEEVMQARDKRNERGSRMALSFALVFLILMLALLAVALTTYIFTDDAEHAVKKSSEAIVDVESRCAGMAVRGVAVGSLSSNLSALVVSNTLQQVQLALPSGTAVSGRAAWVRNAEELWVPDTASSNVYVFETLTWRLLRTLSDARCSHPDFGAYHGAAGADGDGQVWFSCTDSDAFIVYNARTRAREAVIKISSEIDSVYDPYDVRLSQDYAVVSLRNTTGSWSGVLVQYSTDTLLPTRSFVGVGAHVLLWHSGERYARLFASSSFTEDVYAFEFETLRLLNNVTMPTPRGLCTDAWDEFLYVVNAGTDGTDAVYGFRAETLAALDNSPYAAPTNGTFDVITDARSNRVFVTAPNGGTENALFAYWHASDSGALEFDEEFRVNDMPTQLSRVANGCPCRFCNDWRE